MAVIIAGALLCSVRRPGDWGSALTMGLGNILIGAGAAIGAGPHRSWAGAFNLVLGLLLLWLWWTRGGGRGKARRWLGAKSEAIRAVLARRMREAAQPA